MRYILKLVVVLLAASAILWLIDQPLRSLHTAAAEAPTDAPIANPTEAPIASPTEAPTYTLFTNGLWKNTNANLVASSDIYGFSWYSMSKVIAVGKYNSKEGKVWLSSDNGNTFSAVSNVNLASSAVLPALYDVDSKVYSSPNADYSVSIAVGSTGTVIVSHTAGASWTLVNITRKNISRSFDFKAVSISNETAYIMSDTGKVYRSTKLTSSRDFNWTNVSPEGLRPSTVWSDMASFDGDDNFILIVGGFFSLTSIPSTAYYAYSKDGGLTWDIEMVGDNFILESVSCNLLWGKRVCIAGGSFGRLFKIADNGAKWDFSRLAMDTVAQSHDSKFCYNTIQIVNNVVFLATDQGFIYYSYEGGDNEAWLLELDEPHRNQITIYAISMYNSVLGVASGNHGNVWLKFPAPSSQPSRQPSRQPTMQPSRQPTRQPTRQPSTQPSRQPSSQPSSIPSSQPVMNPSSIPSSQPIMNPSSQPTQLPSCQPSRQPTRQPSSQPVMVPTSQPSRQPFMKPTSLPTNQPSSQPSRQPFMKPSSLPSLQPFMNPSSLPTNQPTRQPSRQPFMKPSSLPTNQPSSQPSRQPFSRPSSLPTMQPNMKPSSLPTRQPSRQPTRQPSSRPSSLPTRQPNMKPSAQPSSQPSRLPSRRPSTNPSSQPSRQPSSQPSSQPSFQPSSQPSKQPSMRPTTQPSIQPTGAPTRLPSNQPTSRPTIPSQTTVLFTFTINLIGIEILSIVSQQPGFSYLQMVVSSLMPEVSSNYIKVVEINQNLKSNLRSMSMAQSIDILYEVYFISEWVNDKLIEMEKRTTRMSATETFEYYRNITTTSIKTGLFADRLYTVSSQLSGLENLAIKLRSFPDPLITKIHNAWPTSLPTLSPFPTPRPTPPPPLLTKTQIAIIVPCSVVGGIIAIYYLLKMRRASMFTIKKFPNGSVIKQRKFAYRHESKEESREDVSDVQLAMGFSLDSGGGGGSKVSSITIDGRRSRSPSPVRRGGSPSSSSSKMMYAASVPTPGGRRGRSPNSSLKLSDLRDATPLSSSSPSRSFERSVSAKNMNMSSEVWNSSNNNSSNNSSNKLRSSRYPSPADQRSSNKDLRTTIERLQINRGGLSSGDIRDDGDYYDKKNENQNVFSNNRFANDSNDYYNGSSSNGYGSGSGSRKNNNNYYNNEDPIVSSNSISIPQLERAMSVGSVNTSSAFLSSSGVITNNSNNTGGAGGVMPSIQMPRSRDFELSKGFVTPQDQASLALGKALLNSFNSSVSSSQKQGVNEVEMNPASLAVSISLNNSSNINISNNSSNNNSNSNVGGTSMTPTFLSSSSSPNFSINNLTPSGESNSYSGPVLPGNASQDSSGNVSNGGNGNGNGSGSGALKSPALIRQGQVNMSSTKSGSKALTASSGSSSINVVNSNGSNNRYSSPVLIRQATINLSLKSSSSNKQPSNTASSSGSGGGTSLPVRSLLLRESPYVDNLGDANKANRSSKAKSRKV